jgi:TonB family protein
MCPGLGEGMATVLQDVKGLANALVIRLCTRLAEPDKLSEIVFGTAVAFTFVGAGFCVMQQLEKLHPQIFHDYDICFELNLPAPETHKETAAQVARLKPRVEISKSRNRPVLDPDRAIRNVTATAMASENQSKTPTSEVAGSSDSALAAPMPVSDPGPGAANASVNQAAAEDPGTTNQGVAGSAAPMRLPQADLNAVAGADFGAQKTLAMAAAAPRLYNIKPYKQDLLTRLAKNWQPHKGYDHIVLVLTLTKDGKLTNCELVESCGSEKIDREAMEAIQNTEYAPLPDWYKGEHLNCKLDLATVFKSP